VLAAFAPQEHAERSTLQLTEVAVVSAIADTPARFAPVRADRSLRQAITGSAATGPTRTRLPEPILAPATPEPAEPIEPIERVEPVEPQPEPAASPAWVRPGTGSFSSGFGKRWGRMHKGIDLAAPIGAPIYAASDGVVDYAGPKNGFGRLVTIRHSGGVETWYGHMSVILVHSGENVKAGQVIAKVGNAGHSTGPHLHFEVHVGGTAIDPIPFLRQRGTRI
jgi:murein DD-endopeptidase MepM/ murein hydrolase activator NlpD